MTWISRHYAMAVWPPSTRSLLVLEVYTHWVFVIAARGTSKSAARCVR